MRRMKQNLFSNHQMISKVIPLSYLQKMNLVDMQPPTCDLWK